MPDPIPSCFRGGATASPPPSTASGPNITTSIYETHLGLAALTWSRTVLGLSLRVDLRLPSASSPHSANDSASVSSGASGECADAHFRFRLRPWLFWKRRGSKRFHLKDSQHRTVDFAWDLTRARFPAGGGPEPCIGFFVAVVIDGEMFLIVGDCEGEAYKKTKARNPFPNYPSKKGSPGNPILISRREHVLLPDSGGGRPYTTRARFGGKEREISIDLGGGGEKDARMCLGLDGKRVLQVKRLKWKFRGNEKVEVEGGARVQVSWDVHNWLFDREIAAAASSSTAAAASTSEFGHAVFVFRFDREETEKGAKGYFGKHRNNNNSGNITSHSGGLWGLYGLGSFGNSDKSSSSIGGGGGAKRVGKKRSLLKTSSSSSSSSVSSGSSSSVMEWASAEEGELQGSDGFSLLVSVWKNR